jgi:hypothetical protein
MRIDRKREKKHIIYMEIPIAIPIYRVEFPGESPMGSSQGIPQRREERDNGE